MGGTACSRRHVTGEVCDLGNSGVWEGDYGWGVRVRRPFGARGWVLYGMELGSVTLKINNPHTLESGLWSPATRYFITLLNLLQ